MVSNILELKTSEELLFKLNNLPNKPLSAEDILEQKVSFVMGSMTLVDGMTRASVREMLLKHEGRATESQVDSA